MKALKFGDVHMIVGDELQLVWWAKTNNLTEYQVEFPLGPPQEIAFYFRKEGGYITPPIPPITTTTTSTTTSTDISTQIGSKYKCTITSTNMNSRRGTCRITNCGGGGFFSMCQNCHGTSCQFMLGSGQEGSCCGDNYCCSHSSNNIFGRHVSMCMRRGVKNCRVSCSTNYDPRIHYSVVETETNNVISGSDLGSHGFYSQHDCGTNSACASTFIQQVTIGQTIPCNIDLQSGLVYSTQLIRPNNANIIKRSTYLIIILIVMICILNSHWGF